MGRDRSQPGPDGPYNRPVAETLRALKAITLGVVVGALMMAAARGRERRP
jgi:hypothetical protein